MGLPQVARHLKEEISAVVARSDGLTVEPAETARLCHTIPRCGPVGARSTASRAAILSLMIVTGEAAARASLVMAAAAGTGNRTHNPANLLLIEHTHASLRVRVKGSKVEFSDETRSFVIRWSGGGLIRKILPPAFRIQHRLKRQPMHLRSRTAPAAPERRRRVFIGRGEHDQSKREPPSRWRYKLS